MDALVFYVDFVDSVFATSYNELKSYVGVIYVYRVNI